MSTSDSEQTHLLRKLPYFRENISFVHGQFNNCQLSSNLPSQKNLETLRRIYDLDIFKLNTVDGSNPGNGLYNNDIQCRYYSPYSFHKYKSELPKYVQDSCFVVIHNSIRSLSRNLDHFQTHLLDELDFNFSIIGVSQTKIIRGWSLNFTRHSRICIWIRPNASGFWRCWYAGI